jgi:hypothetical protein
MHIHILVPFPFSPGNSVEINATHKVTRHDDARNTHTTIQRSAASSVSVRRDAPPVHVEFAPRSSNAVIGSGGRCCAGHGGAEVCPGPGARVVDLQVAKEGCTRERGVSGEAHDVPMTICCCIHHEKKN